MVGGGGGTVDEGTAVVVGGSGALLIVELETGGAPGSTPGIRGLAGNIEFEMLYVWVPWVYTPP